MALKFLNKKGWHTGSLRNIENVWKAEQKHEAEQRKLEELRKQIGEEREKAEFRQLQEQAGLVPRQERLDFLYESGLAVGKGSSEGFKALQAPVAAAPAASVAGESSSSKAAAPGALFEDKKPQSANDAWRKLHSDPLLLIRQREQEALARIKNNPIKMAMIKKSVETEKKGKKVKKEKKGDKKHHRSKSNNEKHYEDMSDSEASDDHERQRKQRRESSSSKSKHKKQSSGSDSECSHDERDKGRRDHRNSDKGEDARIKNEKRLSRARSDSEGGSDDEKERRKRHHKSTRHDGDLRHEKHASRVHSYSRDRSEVDDKRTDHSSSKHLGHRYPSRPIEEERRKNGQFASEHEENRKESYQPRYNRSRGVPKMTEEEREARLREMQLDAELHEDQRWKRLKKAADADAQEAMRANSFKGKNFLDDAQKSIFGTEKGGSTTIEESVRRRAFYSQGSSATHDSNAFKR